MAPLILALAHAARVPVAVAEIDPGTPIHADHLRWVELPEDHPLAVDAVLDPVGHIVIERVLEGEILRSERLLDVDKPERIAVPGLRALRVPGIDPALGQAGRRGDLWLLADPPCTLVQGSWILGIGRDMAGNPDSTFLLVAPEQAMAALASDAHLQVRAVSDATATTPRPELMCSP